jgi:hypothetical protein
MGAVVGVIKSRMAVAPLCFFSFFFLFFSIHSFAIIIIINHALTAADGSNMHEHRRATQAGMHNTTGTERPHVSMSIRKEGTGAWRNDDGWQELNRWKLSNWRESGKAWWLIIVTLDIAELLIMSQ